MHPTRHDTPNPLDTQRQALRILNEDPGATRSHGRGAKTKVPRARSLAELERAYLRGHCGDDGLASEALRAEQTQSEALRL